MSTFAQQAPTLSPFPCMCALHALLLSVYKQMVGRASREHLCGGDLLWHTICALPVLLSIYKRVVAALAHHLRFARFALYLYAGGGAGIP